MTKTKKLLTVLLVMALMSLGLPMNVASASGASFTVTYNGNGADSGSVIDPDSPYFANDKVTVLGNGFVREGYIFKGWKAEEVRKPITGSVSPVAYEDIADGFLELFDIIVELRATNNLDLTKPAEYQTIVKASNSSTGQFTFTDVADGEYVLFIYRPGYLLRSMRVTIDQNTTSLKPSDSGVFELIPGDLNCDGAVDGSDVNHVATIMSNNIVFGDPDYEASVDLNADGAIDALDRDIVLANTNTSVFDYTDADDIAFDFVLDNGIDFMLTKNSGAVNHSIGGKLYAVGDKFDMPAANVILYAQWEKIPPETPTPETPTPETPTPETTTPGGVPKTADTSNIWVWIALLSICLSGMVCLLWKKPRKNDIVQ